MSEPRYLTKAQVADVTGKSAATIQRYNRDGRFPRARYAPDGTLEIPVTDLVAAELLDPLHAFDVDSLAEASRTERELHDTKTRLAVAEARLDAATAELAFLRSLLAKDAA